MFLTLCLISALIFALWTLNRAPKAAPEQGYAPGPSGWPLLGNLTQLRDTVPYRNLTAMAKIYGPVYSLQLGYVPAVVVSGLENIKNVLYHKFNHFDSRPNFNRYHHLFDGDKQNSLAFCDWSDVQRKRREMLNDHTFPKAYSNNFHQLSGIISDEVKNLITDIKQNPIKTTQRTKPEQILSKNMKKLLGNKHLCTFVRLASIAEETEEEIIETKNQAVDIKEKLLKATASIFIRYFCSETPEKNEEFTKFIKDFDDIFNEVNKGYISDFIPSLEGIIGNNLKDLRGCSQRIRKYVEENIIKDRMLKIEKDGEDIDYVDCLLKNVKFGDIGGDIQLNKDIALFALEDILGGHSAIGNFLVKTLTYIVDNEEVQNKMWGEIESVGKDDITLTDRDKMPYTEAVMMEALRLIASPIVPHVANQDTQISGYSVKKGTLVFLNNYDLNMNADLWTEPEKFNPDRFLDGTGQRVKPSHFLPFGGGRRSCMGYKLVQFVGFLILANLVKNMKICGVPGEEYSKVPIGNLALPENTFKFVFQQR